MMRLRSAGFRITPARIKLLNEISRQAGPVTVEELHRNLGARRCDIVTVYRCMSALESQDVVRKSYRRNGTVRYERNLGEPPRYHVVCRGSGSVDAIDAEAAIRLEEALRDVERVLRARGCCQVTHRVEFFGDRAAGAGR